MSIIASIRIPNYIVIAGDSVLTLMKHEEFNYEYEAVCPACDHKYTIHDRLKLNPVPASNFYNVNKIIPFLNRFGIGISHTNILGNIPAHSLIQKFEERFNKDNNSEKYPDIIEVVEKLIKLFETDFIHPILDARKSEDLGTEQFGDYLVFQIVGYQELDPKTIEVSIGKESRYEVFKEFGCTISGYSEIVQSIWGIDKRYKEQHNADVAPPYNIFSLQDAIDYVEFIIKSSIDYQKFAKMIPYIGGKINTAIISYSTGFKWKTQKSIKRITGA